MKVLSLLVAALPFTTALFNRHSARSMKEAARIKAERDVDPSTLYKAHTLQVPVDHFPNSAQYAPHSTAKFPLRYWFDAQYYKAGGPVIVLQSGETSGTDRLPYLQKGLLIQMAEATNGIAVVLEHRYYGTSNPTKDYSTENLRFLTTEQALADEAYFARNVKFAGLEGKDLTSKTTAYIGYGGSYAGAFNAFLRIDYPNDFWGTISSSGVTKAIWDFWEYYSPVAEYGPKQCIAAQKTFTHIVDNILIGHNSPALTKKLKTAFGMPNVTHNSDFASVLSYGISNWQSNNWDPEVGSPEFGYYCSNISSTQVLYPSTKSLAPAVKSLITAGGYTANQNLVNQMLNYIGYVNLTAVSGCTDADQDSCFSSYDPAAYQATSIAEGNWRPWPYQYCTEWGYLQTGSGVPKNQLPVISRTIDLEYESLICKYAFNITTPANVDRVNKYGGYDVCYNRLAFVDGQWDPWRPATPHAFEQGARQRTSTTDEPFILIAKGEHHYDENGRFPNETTPDLPPKPVADAQHQEIAFVKAWMQEYHSQHYSS